MAALSATLAEDVAAQKAVFVKDLDEGVYSALKNDGVRMRGYQRAIEGAVPGKRVLDIGTGPEALLAIVAAKAGATSVVACEVNPAAAAAAVEAVRAAGLEDKITILTGHSSELDLPPVDVVVSEIVGDIASEEGMAATLAALPETTVVRSDGWSVPRRAETWIAPANLRLPQQGDGDGPTHVRLPTLPPAACLLGERALMEILDASRMGDLDQTRAASWTVAAPSTLTGFFCAPKLYLDATVVIDCWEEQTSWRSVLCLLPEPALVEPGDVVGLTVTAALGRFPVTHTLATTVNGKPLGDIVLRLNE